MVVTVQHRLNAFGYLYLARLDPRFPDSGNLGQLDLILALRWIRANIAGYGGDPGRVTVFGQSGGGAKIATLMGMAAARRPVPSRRDDERTAGHRLGPAACDRAGAGLSCARWAPAPSDDLLAMPVARLVEGLAADDPILPGRLYFGPVLDMKWLTRHPFWPDANPLAQGIPAHARQYARRDPSLLPLPATASSRG